MRVPRKNADPLWYKDAVFYELHVRSFFDSNGDGIGDFRGLIEKLDYLEELGIDAIWLLPFYPSPLKDDGYDVIDHYDVHPDYGTLSDFKDFLKEAHNRGIRVVTELILNHTSDQHPWFKKARKSRIGSPSRDFYVWSDTTDRYKDAKLIFPKEEESNWTYDDEASAYYWHRYRASQPELNYENPAVHLEMIRIADFWLKMGVDGFRLPSVAFLYEQEGTDCENLPQTHAFLKKLRAHIDKNYKDRVLIAEANLWPEEAATYFGDSDECHMNFHYPLMPRLFLALRTEDADPVRDIIEQTPPTPENCQWALFLRNHDELGLQMVAEEEQHFLLKAFATDPKTKFNMGIRRRLAPLLNNDRRRIELMHMLLFSLPGTPVMYYGDEIGMGDNVYLGDRFGVRTPMQWNANLNAGFSTANPQQLFLPVIQDPEYRYEFTNVARAEANPSSLLSWMKHTIGMRRRLDIFGRATTEFIDSSNSKVLAFVRSYEGKDIIVVANLSQFAQSTVLKSPLFKDRELTEVFSQNRFAKPASEECTLTMSPYGYFWLQAERADRRDRVRASGEFPLIKSSTSWERFFENYNDTRDLERKVLPIFMNKCRWFGGKAKVINKIAIEKAIPFKVEGDTHFLLIVDVHYAQRLPEYYFIPVTFLPESALAEQVEYTSQSIICRIEIQGEKGFLMDSVYDDTFRDLLFSNMQRGVRLRSDEGVLEFNFGMFTKPSLREVKSKILKADQSNTAIIFGDEYFFKFYRKVEKEINPDLEIIRFLTENTSFRHSPRYAGSIEYQDNDGTSIVLGLLQEKVDNQGDAWVMIMERMSEYYDAVLALSTDVKFPPLIEKVAIRYDETPELIQRLISRNFHDLIVRLGQRTAEMHKALASGTSDAAFSPELITHHYQRSLYSSLRKLLRDRFSMLEDALPGLDAQTRSMANEVLSFSQPILDSFAEMYQTRISAIKTRIHGDYHLGQVLFTGDDFVIIDFEGEPAFSFTERRLKKSPMKDVAGMMRSFHYAAYGKILLNETYRNADDGRLERAAEQWQHYVSRYFLGAYMEHAGLGSELSKENRILIRTFLLEKAIYELGYELNARPDWVNVPLKGIHYLVKRYLEERARH
jgi:maltose alpha-D-glucosyltransferase/alpha-amylase